MSDELTFRHFAAAIMDSNWDRAAEVLSVLLAVDQETAAGAASHFKEQMASTPEFMMKAMSMRQVVTGGERAPLLSLLTECFGLQGEVAEASATAVLARYGG